MTKTKNRLTRQRGSAILELGVVTPVLLAVLGGAMDFARVFALGLAVSNAARAGVQYGFQSSSNYTDYTGMQTAALNSQPGITGLTAVATEYCEVNGVSATCSGSGQDVYLKVTTTATYTLLCTYLLLPRSITVSKSALLRIQ